MYELFRPTDKYYKVAIQVRKILRSLQISYINPETEEILSIYLLPPIPALTQNLAYSFTTWVVSRVNRE